MDCTNSFLAMYLGSFFSCLNCGKKPRNTIRVRPRRTIKYKLIQTTDFKNERSNYKVACIITSQ